MVVKVSERLKSFICRGIKKVCSESIYILQSQTREIHICNVCGKSWLQPAVKLRNNNNKHYKVLCFSTLADSIHFNLLQTIIAAVIWSDLVCLLVYVFFLTLFLKLLWIYIYIKLSVSILCIWRIRKLITTRENVQLCQFGRRMVRGRLNLDVLSNIGCWLA